ncbi:MAG: carbohydrate binding family 9 domain-containing protein [Bacteroidales bacterium]|nr:carbohydrate binding family 9 domain-containing protein [Bacteroidales bacterium]
MSDNQIIPLLIACMTLLSPQLSHAQSVEALQTETEIQVDGVLDEADWDKADILTGFTQLEPAYGQEASFRTKVRVLYSKKYIYFGIECDDPDPDKISTKITKRDGEVSEDDAIALVLDSFDDDNNAYYFIVNALGTQQDERWADNGRTQDTKWDVTWKSAGKITPNGWTAEVAIPFSSIRFDRKKTNWGLNVIRYIPRKLEMSHWVPGLSEWFRIAEIGNITGLKLLETEGKRFSFIPYAQMQVQDGSKPTFEVGGDVRVNLSSNLSLDATVNPDFATIEGDVEQVNLTRFELSYPEKRPFFMEGAENYSTRIKQFYSRRIGDIPWGVKFNGKVDKWKINALTTQSDPNSVNANLEPGDNALYSVFRVNRDLKNASNIGIIGANRMYKGQNQGSLGLASTLFFTRYIGMTSQLVKSYGEFKTGSWTYFLRPSFDSKTTHFHVRYTHVGENVKENMNAIGMIRDDNRREFDTNLRHKFWINQYGLEEVSPSVNYNMYWGMGGVLRSWEVDNSLTTSFLKKWKLRLSWSEEFKRFEKDFRNRDASGTLNFNNKRGLSLSTAYGRGINYDRDLQHASVGFNVKILDGWNLSYLIRGYWFDPDNDDDNTVIHYVRSTYYLNKDLYFKLFYQSRYDVTERVFNPDFDLTRQTAQFVFVWRFLPPFGSIQLAYQRGATIVTEEFNQNQSIFAKLSWVF